MEKCFGSMSFVVYKFRRLPVFELIFISQSISELVGYTPDELYKENYLTEGIIYQEDKEKFSKLIESSNQIDVKFTIRYNHRNGKIVWTEHHLNLVDEIGFGTITDITDKIQTEKKLNELEERLSISMLTTGISIIEWDINTGKISIKNSIEDVLGMELSEVENSIDAYFSIIHPDDKSSFLNSIAQALQFSNYFSAEHRVIDKYNQIRWIKIYSQIFRDDTGNAIRLLASIRNISEIKKSELDRQGLINRAKHQSKSIVELALDDDFASGNLEISLKLILSKGAEVLGVDRISIWMFNEEYTHVDCILSYSGVVDEFVQNYPRLFRDQMPIYFDSVLGLRVFVSNDTMNEEVASEFKSFYSEPIQLGAVMDASIRVRGKIIGILSIEEMGKSRVWHTDEITYAGLLADQTAIAIINSERRKSEEQVMILNKNLERIVEERTLQLTQSNSELSHTLENLSKTQDQLIMSEKMAALGQLIAGIAHEINNPIASINASIQMIILKKSPLFSDINKPNLDLLLGKEIKSMAEDLFTYIINQKDIPTGLKRRNKKNQLEKEFGNYSIGDKPYLAEKCIDLGIHFFPSKYNDLLNHPFAEDILNFILDRVFQEKSFVSIEYSLSRVTSIIKSLRNFSFKDNFEKKTLYSVEESIQTVITLFNNKIKNGVELILDYKKVPKIICYPDDLIHLWTNLIQNSLHAMDYKGRLEIKVYKTKDKPEINIKVIDSGTGISDSIKDKIFEPFFTTKALGEGSGLGLGICKKIVQSHNGNIIFDSIPGRTEFHIILPVS